MALPDDGQKRELVNGEIIMVPAGAEHGYIAVRLISALDAFVRTTRLGAIFDSGTGFWMVSGNCRAPDASFVRKERLAGSKRPPKGFFHGAPDLAVEILSPNDTIEGIHGKLLEYFENGTALVWVVNPEEQTVLVYHAPQPDQLLRPGMTLDGERLLPGFSLAVGELFAELDFSEERGQNTGPA